MLSLSPASLTSGLRIDVVFEGIPMARDTETTAMGEVARIWKAYGVDIQSTSSDRAPRDGSVRVAVVLVDGRDGRIHAGALGSILFSDNVPEPAVLIYRSAIDALLEDAVVLGQNSRDWSRALRDRVLGRVIGRALAHELGHYLLRSRQHAADGLMRARHLTGDLVAPESHRFALSASEAAVIASTMSSSMRMASR